MGGHPGSFIPTPSTHGHRQPMGATAGVSKEHIWKTAMPKALAPAYGRVRNRGMAEKQSKSFASGFTIGKEAKACGANTEKPQEAPKWQACHVRPSHGWKEDDIKRYLHWANGSHFWVC